MRVAALIVAAGRGRRMGAETPKQYLDLGQGTAIDLSVAAFLALDATERVLPVIQPDDAALCGHALRLQGDPRLMAPVAGGETRALSVRAGLEALAPHAPDAVLIHDAARPFVPRAVIEAVIAALAEADGACAALPVVDALWSSDGVQAARPVPRDGLWRAQTPQGFRFAPILAAHRAHGGGGADDVAVAREAGMAVRFVLGSEDGYKITTQADLVRARAHVTRRG